MSFKRIMQIKLNKICPDLYNSLIFLLKNKYICNVKRPKTFNEKIQWRKKYQHDERYPFLVDKWEVRQFIKNKFPEILIPTFGVYDNPEDINIEDLPEKFIMKPTHGFGKVIICTDKSNIDIDQMKQTVKSWFSYNQYLITGEWQYKDLKSRVIVDKLIGENIKDYKIFCFHGKPFAIQIDSDRYLNHKRQFRDIEWNKMDFRLAYPDDTTELKKPKDLERILAISKNLSKDFDFVRVDLFLVDGKIYFSELTFTPGNGMDRFFPKEMDYVFGEKWLIKDRKK